MAEKTIAHLCPIRQKEANQECGFRERNKKPKHLPVNVHTVVQHAHGGWRRANQILEGAASVPSHGIKCRGV